MEVPQAVHELVAAITIITIAVALIHSVDYTVFGIRVDVSISLSKDRRTDVNVLTTVTRAINIIAIAKHQR